VSTLVVGLGCRSGVRFEDVAAVLAALLQRHRLSPADVVGYATIEARAGEPGLRAVAGDRLRCFPAHVLATVAVPHPSAGVALAVGTPSVAEAAALCAAAELARPGSPVELVAPKLAGSGVTAAAARFGV
jgi:cobalamin biosynthesis protein CbiG